MSLLTAIGVMASISLAGLPEWTFDTDLQGWTPNAQITGLSFKNGRIMAKTRGSDPFFTCSGIEFPAKPWQYVLVTIQANRSGHGQLFWTGETTGQYGGFSEKKCADFLVDARRSPQEVAIFPFWQTEGAIRQLRLDLYDNTQFVIDSIRVLEWGAETEPQANVFSWKLDDPNAWRLQPSVTELFAPPLNLTVDKRNWAAITLKCHENTTASFLWSCADLPGIQHSDFDVRGSAAATIYNVELQGNPAWHSPVVAIGVRLPRNTECRLCEVNLTDRPQGGPQLVVDHAAFEDAIHHAGRPCGILAQISNRGGGNATGTKARLALGPDMSFENCVMEQAVPDLAGGESAEVRWTVRCDFPEVRDIYVQAGNSKARKVSLSFTKNPLLPKAGYPFEPQPIATVTDVCAYYFPGWDTDAKWDCIRRTAPIRKPMLGYYDEGNPECVDWQIKWAVENGISCFLVDWYWCEGRQSHTHWFEAYRKARFRDDLKVAIMWANHNAPNTHSAEDWRKVTQEWIDRYFNLPAYYRINGKPAVFIWAPSNIRRDLSGSDAVKASMSESQEMARNAGYEGITFVAMNSDFNPSEAATLSNEGYTGITTYHEWGGAMPKRAQYKTVVEDAPRAWKTKVSAVRPLTYFPVVDTGWDSRPWHGDKAMAIEGRTPELFGKLLKASRKFVEENNLPLVILGPVNEWGEGSYIEPCVEYGFAMYDAVREAFCLHPPSRWVGNFGPADIGCGPYDFPAMPVTSAWTFDNAETGWNGLMGVGDMTYADGRLSLTTLSDDPALISSTHGVQAADFAKAAITMQIVGQVPDGSRAQLFWSPDAETMTETTSVSFPLNNDGQMHSYTVDLKANPRWRGRITALRLDPCSVKGVQVVLDEIRLTP